MLQTLTPRPNPARDAASVSRPAYAKVVRGRTAWHRLVMRTGRVILSKAVIWQLTGGCWCFAFLVVAVVAAAVAAVVAAAAAAVVGGADSESVTTAVAAASSLPSLGIVVASTLERHMVPVAAVVPARMLGVVARSGGGSETRPMVLVVGDAIASAALMSVACGGGQL